MSSDSAATSVKAIIGSIPELRPLVHIVSNYLTHRSAASLSEAISCHISDYDASFDAYVAVMGFAAALDEHSMTMWPDRPGLRSGNISDVSRWLTCLHTDSDESYYLFKYYADQTQALISALGVAVIESQAQLSYLDDASNQETYDDDDELYSAQCEQLPPSLRID